MEIVVPNHDFSQFDKGKLGKGKSIHVETKQDTHINEIIVGACCNRTMTNVAKTW